MIPFPQDQRPTFDHVTNRGHLLKSAQLEFGTLYTSVVLNFAGMN